MKKLRLMMLLYLRRAPWLFKTVVFVRNHLPMSMSVFLHVSVVVFLTVDFAAKESKKPAVVSVPMFVVDLNKVKIGEVTNLPPKLVESSGGKKPAAKTRSVRTSAYSKAGTGLSRGGAGADKSPSGAHLSTGNVKPAGKPDAKTAAETDKAVAKMLNSLKSSGQGGGGTAKDDDSYRTLLASVDGIRQSLGRADEAPPDLAKEDMLTDGIEGGEGGSYMQELSVSEKDMLGLRLRGCWNMDAGVRGVKDMLIEIRVWLDRDGTVKDVKILNAGRMKKDAAFRSVAESARRAVYVCDRKKDESPFKLFPKNYKNTYDTWKTLLLRFNPLDGGVG